jgi:hypothetical protein
LEAGFAEWPSTPLNQAPLEQLPLFYQAFSWSLFRVHFQPIARNLFWGQVSYRNSTSSEFAKGCNPSECGIRANGEIVSNNNVQRFSAGCPGLKGLWTTNYKDGDGRQVRRLLGHTSK